MSLRSQIRRNFWNRLRNTNAKEVLVFGLKWPFLVLSIFKYFYSKYRRTLHKKSFAQNQNFFCWVYWDARNCQKMAFLTEFSWPVHNFSSRPISKISTDLRSMKKRFLSCKTREKILRLTLVMKTLNGGDTCLIIVKKYSLQVIRDCLDEHLS